MRVPADIAAFRFGYGLPLPAGAAVTPDAMQNAVSGPDVMRKTWSGIGLKQALALHQSSVIARKAARLGETERANYRAGLRLLEGLVQQATQVSFARALDAKDGFRERLVRFWADHFTTIGRFKQDRILPFAMIEDAIRPHVAGRFSDLLTAATLHPAMLVYLDQVRSVGPASVEGLRHRRGLNENLGRELIELHTLGVGAGYSQSDVRELAELLTGLNFQPGKGQVFQADWAEPGAETVLGKTYGPDGIEPIRAVLADLANRPETARHIARKLAVHFVSDDPDAALVTAIADAFLASEGDLRAVYGAMLGHPAAWVDPMQKARQPFDFMVSSLRALGVSGADIMAMAPGRMRRFVVQPLKTMGQDWAGPNGPDGWAEAAENWITPQGLAARIAWSVEIPSRLVDALPDPRRLAETALGSLATERLLWTVAASDAQRDGVALVLASPEFNRR